MANNQNSTYYSNVPISMPVFYPDYELKTMNGFAFTHIAGMVLQYNGTESVDWMSLLL